MAVNHLPTEASKGEVQISFENSMLLEYQSYLINLPLKLTDGAFGAQRFLIEAYKKEGDLLWLACRSAFDLLFKNVTKEEGSNECLSSSSI
jgi:hypothetical protein